MSSHGQAADKHQDHTHPSFSLQHVDSLPLSRRRHPPPPPTPPSPPSVHLDRRPSTAPGPQTSPAHDALLLLPSSQTTGFKANRAASVRKSLTISNLHFAQDSGLGRVALTDQPSSYLNSLSGLLSPNALAPTTSSLSRSSSKSDRRPSSSRRPPASFSANGIATSFGPPPALITRNPYNSELARLAQSPAASTFAAQQQKTYNSSTFPVKGKKSTQSDSSPTKSRFRDRIAGWTQQKVQGLLSPLPFANSSMDSLDAVVRKNRSNWQSQPSEQVNDLSPGAAPRAAPQHVEEGIESSHSSEDLFLKLANDQDAGRHTQKEAIDLGTRLDNLQIRGRRSNDRASVTSEIPPYSRRRNSSPPEPSTSQRLSNLHNPTAYRKPSGAASVVGIPTRTQSLLTPEQKFASYRARYNGPQTPSVVSKASDTASMSHRRASATEQLIARGHYQRQSRLNNTSTRDSDYSPSQYYSSFQQDPRTDGESVVSTVQSNLWDDTPEMKSRVLRPEHGRLFHSGGTASNGSAERPRTATTTVTTVSSSPKVAMGYKSAGDGNLGGPEAATLHPNLHQSLMRCKTILPPAVYRALEGAASEALDLAVSARSSGTNGSVYSSMNGINGLATERQTKRKADNICRNLTDLCVALIDGHAPQETLKRFSAQSFNQRRESRDTPLMISKVPSETLPKQYSRHASLEPQEARPASSRALERVEARRASLMSNATPASSPRESQQTATQRTAQDQAKSSPLASNLRSGTSLLQSRRAQQEEDDDQSSLRAPSRALTEVGQMLRKRSNRISSGLGTGRNTDGQYTSQHPLPQNNAFRRVTGGGLTNPTTPTSSSLLRGASRLFGSDRLSTGEATDEDDKKIKRRSFGLYGGSSASIATTRSHNLRPASLSAK